MDFKILCTKINFLFYLFLEEQREIFHILLHSQDGPGVGPKSEAGTQSHPSGWQGPHHLPNCHLLSAMVCISGKQETESEPGPPTVLKDFFT